MCPLDLLLRVRQLEPTPLMIRSTWVAESAVQGSIVIITTAAGRLQDKANNSLDPTISLWLAYAFICFFVSATLLSLTYVPFGQKMLPGARLSQVAPRKLTQEINRLAARVGLDRKTKEDGGELTAKEKERILKSPNLGRPYIVGVLLPSAAFSVVIIGWVIFGVGISWGIHAMTNGSASGD